MELNVFTIIAFVVYALIILGIGIYSFKKKFSGLFCEFAGEFELPVRPVCAALWRALSPAALRLRRRLRRH